MLSFYSCVQNQVLDPGFKDMISMSIYDYIANKENVENYSSFLSILEKGGLDKTLSAYNPDGQDYTLFLPDNAAVDRFIKNSNRFSSLDDLLKNTDYINTLCRYHVISRGIKSNNFPFGAFPVPTLSDDYLTVTFVIEPDTSYYKINNQAPVIYPDIEVSNGYIHLVSEMLTPITYTSYGWLALNPGYSIFKQAVDATGFKNAINVNLKNKDINALPVTMIIEHDSIFKKHKINSFNDLVNMISPNRNDYTNSLNPLNNFVGYHILSGNYFLDDFEGQATNFSSLSDVPVNINGLGLDIAINKGKEIFDTIMINNNPTIIDYIGFNYDASNVITQSGAIHFIEQVMTVKTPSRATVSYDFWEEPLLNEHRNTIGSHLIEDKASLNRISWSGADLFFVKGEANSQNAWGNDYLQIDGNFKVSYRIPKIVQGKYNAFLGAHAYNTNNALVEVSIDGKGVGGLIDLSSGGSSDYPFARIKLGTFDFLKYSEHTIEVSSLIPGTFLWDYVSFEPY
jgi:uncharacterized surface protein with fasciclin (FAS1) repeats